MSNQPGTSIRFNCTQCQKALSVPESNAGKTITCPECQASQLVPASASVLENEAPAPVVNSSFEAVPAQRPKAVAAPIAAEVPMMQPTSEAPVVQTLSMGSSEAADPMAAVPKPRTPGSGLSPRVGTSAPRAERKTPEKKPASRGPILAVAGVVVIAALAGVGITIKNGMERKQIQEDIDGLLSKAQAAYVDGDIDGAAKNAATAQERIKTSPQTLDGGLVKKWTDRAKLYSDMREQVAQAQAILADAEKDSTQARIRLENKKALLTPSDDNKPVLAKFDQILADIEKLEKKKKLDKLKNDIVAADKLYREGKIEDAADKAAIAVKAMDISPKVQDGEIEKRADVLRKRAEQIRLARSTRLSANKNFAEAKKKLQAQLDAIDDESEELRPLKSAIATLRKEVQDEEKLSKKLSPEETAELNAFVSNLKQRDNNVRAIGIQGESLAIEYDGKPLKVGFHRTPLSRQIIIEAGDNRFAINQDALAGMKARSGRVLRHAIAVGEAMKKAGLVSEDIWDASFEAPLPSARRTGDDGREYLFLADRLYAGKPQPKGESEKEVEDNYKKVSEALAVAVEKDEATPEEVRQVVAFGVRCSAKSPAEEDWYDHLRGEFIRDVINEGYIEKNMAGAAQRLKQPLDAWREAFKKISTPRQNFEGTTGNGDRVREHRTFEEHSIWQIYDKTANSTTFAIKNPDEEKDCLFILYEFAGSHEAFPEKETAKAVRMTHQSVGVIASYDPATGKMEHDAEKWNLAAALETPNMPPEFVAAKGFGTPGWALPPHVLLVDYMGNTRSIITPHGKLDIQEFGKIADKAKREAAMEEFLGKMAKVLPSANYLHLYFRYFHEYILDSPITSHTGLLGSRAHCGDIHQTAYESLERMVGGRYVGDCDDLAEFYVNVSRRQNKLSYVMALPAHAACGWVERPGGKEGDYTFYVIDTGPPRQFTHRELEKSIEMACRAYDDNKTMRFDPKSLGFLFRFNGEQTRTPYYLSSRMYIDREYGEAMERVQSYWHFHFYALGIKTMTEMIEKGDRVPENCVELAGLYGQVHEIEESIKWTNEALKQFGEQDRASRFSEQFRIAMMWREDHNNEKSYEAMKPMIAELRRLERDQQWFNYTSMRLQTMGLLESIDRPFEAWELVQHDIIEFARRGVLRIEHVGGLTEVYAKMAQLKREGKEIKASDATQMKRLEQILTFFYDKALFAEPDDDFNAYMRKYAFLGLWYAGKYGLERLEQELVKDGPWPEADKPRDHRNRNNPEEEDWKWIRLSLPAYAIVIAKAVDMDEPPEKWRKDDAVKLIDAMNRAAERAKKFGSLASSEFQLLSLRVFRDFMVKDWKDLEKVLEETKQRDWARLTTEVAETFGRSARFVSKDEFAAQFKVFTKYIKARTSYYTVVYEAYRADAYDQALVASEISLQCNPGDEDMVRENKYLKELAAKKIAKSKAEQKKPEKAPDAKP